MGFRPLFIPLVTSLFLCGCANMTSVHPLSAREKAVPDERLEGFWMETVKDKSGNYPIYLYLTYGKDGQGWLHTFGSGDKGLQTWQCNFFTTRTAKHCYLDLSHCISRDGGDVTVDRSGEYSFVEYRLTWLGKLELCAPDIDAFADAVRAGKLKGKVVDNSNQLGGSVDVDLRDPSGHILSFIEGGAPNELFSPALLLSKLGGPTSTMIPLLLLGGGIPPDSSH
jgi:hypothetical protein